MTLRAYYGGMAATALLAGCAAVVEPQPSKEAQDALEQVRASYDAGRYGDVIREVARSDVLADAPKSIRVEALKLQSFSYCVNNYRVLCEDGFRRILAIDPTFTLAPAEAGHPQWGPAYQAARGARGG
ncbi:TssQ family T6SS-associated lipoprotein [Bordetella sp. 2513F-2]